MIIDSGNLGHVDHDNFCSVTVLNMHESWTHAFIFRPTHVMLDIEIGHAVILIIVQLVVQPKCGAKKMKLNITSGTNSISGISCRVTM